MENNNIIKSFELQDELNPKIWIKQKGAAAEKIKPEVREKLLEIAYEFIQYLNVDVIVSDVHLTGSLANYNWSQYSDFDLHIIADFNQFPKSQLELYQELFDLKKTLFNSTQNIKIFGFDVELFVQDSNEKRTASAGIFSLITNKWLEKPRKETFKINKSVLKSKIDQWTEKIDKVLESADEEKELSKSKKIINNIKDKIKKYRKTGLDKGGEMSYENLVFKYLRRSGHIEKLFNYKKERVDKELSIENYSNGVLSRFFLNEAEFAFNPSGSYSDPTFGLPSGGVDSGKVAAGGKNGNWDGAMPRALAFAKLANEFMGKNVISSQKRSRVKTASGRVSDHYEGMESAYAVDLACRGEKGDALLAHLMNWFGHPEVKGGRWVDIIKDGYRYQIGWRVKNHFDHIHIGVKKVGADVPNTKSSQTSTEKTDTEKSTSSKNSSGIDLSQLTTAGGLFGGFNFFDTILKKLRDAGYKIDDKKIDDLKSGIESQKNSSEKEVKSGQQTVTKSKGKYFDKLPKRVQDAIKKLESKHGIKVTDEHIAKEFEQEGNYQEDAGGENSQARKKIEELIRDAKIKFPKINSSRGIVSGYRSYDKQVDNFGSKAKSRGVDNTQSANALPGFSQHHNGKTFDIFTTETSWWNQNSDVKNWVAQNASKYGFDVTYKTNGPLRIAEPWHLYYTG
jgi:LAS superfamily LD-carboxypeptidase LdcB